MCQHVPSRDSSDCIFCQELLSNTARVQEGFNTQTDGLESLAKAAVDGKWYNGIPSPGAILDLIARLRDTEKERDILRDSVGEKQEYYEAVMKELYRKLNIDGSDGELRFKWVSLALSEKMRELDSLKAKLDRGVRVTATLDGHQDYNGWFAHQYGPCNATIVLDDGVGV